MAPAIFNFRPGVAFDHKTLEPFRVCRRNCDENDFERGVARKPPGNRLLTRFFLGEKVILIWFTKTERANNFINYYSRSS